MKAAQIDSYAEPAAVIIKQIDKPLVQADQVLVEVYAASVNPFDYKLTSGAYKDFMPLKLPITLGGDLSGVVTQVGEQVTGFSLGQAVYGQANATRQGSLAEFAPVKASQLALKPKSVDYQTAAALPLVSASAYQAIYEHLELNANQRILIHGGGGGIGAMAIQLAKNLGAYVAITVSTKDIDYVKRLGADEVIDYHNQDFSRLLKDYDSVFDTVGGDVYTKSYLVLKPGGKLVSMLEQPSEDLAKQYKVKAVHQSTKTSSDKLARIAQLVDEAKLSVNIDKVFSLEQTAQALEYLKTGHPRGKVVVKVKT